MQLDQGRYHKLYVIPQSVEDREFLQAVDRKTRVDVELMYGIIIDYDWKCNTIANCVVKSIVQTLAYFLLSNPGKGVGIDFYDLFISSVTTKRNSDAEKEGNINAAFEPGKIAEDLIANGNDNPATKDRISPADAFQVEKVDEELYAQLEHHAKYALTMTHGVLFPDNSIKYTVFAICHRFIYNIYTELLYRLSRKEFEEGAATKIESVNFNDNIEFHATMDRNGDVLITMTPGMYSKLAVKSDAGTEDTRGDGDDYDD